LLSFEQTGRLPPLSLLQLSALDPAISEFWRVCPYWVDAYTNPLVAAQKPRDLAGQDKLTKAGILYEIVLLVMVDYVDQHASPSFLFPAISDS
jgi:hypothetical protein